MLFRLAILALFLQIPSPPTSRPESQPPGVVRPEVPAPREVLTQTTVIRIILPPGWRVRRPTGITDGTEIIELVGP